jgi:hypothetical protein
MLNETFSMSNGDLFDDSQITIFPQNLNNNESILLGLEHDDLMSQDEQCKLNSIARNYDANSSSPRFPDEVTFNFNMLCNLEKDDEIIMYGDLVFI